MGAKQPRVAEVRIENNIIFNAKWEAVGYIIPGDRIYLQQDYFWRYRPMLKAMYDMDYTVIT